MYGTEGLKFFTLLTQSTLELTHKVLLNPLLSYPASIVTETIRPVVRRVSRGRNFSIFLFVWRFLNPPRGDRRSPREGREDREIHSEAFGAALPSPEGN